MSIRRQELLWRITGTSTILWRIVILPFQLEKIIAHLHIRRRGATTGYTMVSIQPKSRGFKNASNINISSRVIARLVGGGLLCLCLGRFTIQGGSGFGGFRIRILEKTTAGVPTTAYQILEFPHLLQDNITDLWKRQVYAQLDRVR